MRICLYSTISTDWDLALVPHWIRHYHDLGIEPGEFFLVLHARQEGASLAQARDLLAVHGMQPRAIWIGPFSSDENYRYRRSMWQACELGPDDWFLIADADEFHEYPSPLATLLARCNEEHYNAVEGRLIDHVAAEGEICPVAESPGIFEQFPKTVDITYELLGMNVMKIVAHQRTTFSGRLRRANHGIDPEFAGATRVLPMTCLVHHFKWQSRVVEKLRQRADYYQCIGRTTDAARNLRLLARFGEHGKLPIH